MSHFTVLVVGENWEQQLEPFWELDLPHEEIQNDSRAEFNLKISEEDLEKEFENFKIEYPKDKDKYQFAKEWGKNYHGYVYNKEEKGYGYYRNPNSKWDWYLMGGRWSGFFKLKDNTESEIKLGEPGAFNNQPREGYVDQALKGDIDFEGMTNDVVEKSEEEYNKFHNILNGRTVPIWKEILEKYGTEKIDDARKEYNENQVIKDLMQAGYHFNIEKFLIDKETFLKISADSAFVTYALVKDGEWHQRGEMGWFGMSSNEKENDVWNSEFHKIIDSLPDDTILTLVDCHI